MVFIETPTNPVMSLVDIRAVSEITRRVGGGRDKYFMSPFFPRPLELGADIVVHRPPSTECHSDGVGGAVSLTMKKTLPGWLSYKTRRGDLSPMDSCW